MKPGLRKPIAALLIIAVTGILTAAIFVLGGRLGWFQNDLQKMGLELKGHPALLFFNNYALCPSKRDAFRAVDVQVMTWKEAERGGVPVITIDPQLSPELTRHYEVLSLPALLLVDGKGTVLLRQDGLGIGLEPTLLDLAPFEDQIRVLR